MNQITIKNPREVVIAIIKNAQNKLLITYRQSWVSSQPKKWEFPGGKVETGETLKISLIRELQEEIGIIPPRAVSCQTLFL